MAREVLPLPDKPSIAVLAFTNMSGDPEQEYFSDGIAEDIITELSRSRSLFVIARNSSFTYKGRAVDVKQVARELGVRYVLEGSVRRSGRACSGHRAAYRRRDRQSHLGGTLRSRSGRRLRGAGRDHAGGCQMQSGPAVADAEQRRSYASRPRSLGAWEAYQRGLWHLGKMHRRRQCDRREQFFQQRHRAGSHVCVCSCGAMRIRII